MLFAWLRAGDAIPLAAPGYLRCFVFIVKYFNLKKSLTYDNCGKSIISQYREFAEGYQKSHDGPGRDMAEIVWQNSVD